MALHTFGGWRHGIVRAGQWSLKSRRLGRMQGWGACPFCYARQRGGRHRSPSVLSGRRGAVTGHAEALDVTPPDKSDRELEKTKRTTQSCCTRACPAEPGVSERHGMSRVYVHSRVPVLSLFQDVSVQSPGRRGGSVHLSSPSSLQRSFSSMSRKKLLALSPNVPENTSLSLRSLHHIPAVRGVGRLLSAPHAPFLDEPVAGPSCRYSSLSSSRQAEDQLTATGRETPASSVAGLGPSKSSTGWSRRQGIQESQEAAGRTQFHSASSSPDLSSTRAWTLDSGEIEPVAFSDVKVCRDFSFPALPELLSRLKEQKQSLVLGWRDRALVSTQHMVHNDDKEGPTESSGRCSLEACRVKAEKEVQAELQRRIHVLELFLSDLEENWEDQLAFLPSPEVVACTVKVAAGIVAAERKTSEAFAVHERAEKKEQEEEATESDLPLGSTAVADRELVPGHDGGCRGDPLAQGLGEQERTAGGSLERQWELCVERLKQLALDEEVRTA